MMMIMLASMTFNYLFGIWLDKTNDNTNRKWVIALATITNIGLLIYFKYANFFADNYNFAARAMGFSVKTWETIVLPLGISFFTFHGLSYVIDVYRKKTEVQKNPFTLALYITFFPQLIAGPIVRYHDIAEQLENRKESIDLFVSGIKRFIIGLAKKVLIANQVAKVAELVFQTPTAELAPDLSWIGLIAVSIQIYFDFSGYSDMAIGLARMFGFKFPENFIFPLSSKSAREFWTRWHISLSSWFKDYVFIPLGGSRKSKLRTLINLWIIFFLMGFWHGAEWIFIAFGVWHGLFIVAERAGLEKLMKPIPGIFKNLYVWIIYMVGNIIFSSPDIGYIFRFCKTLFVSNHNTMYSNIWNYIHPGFIFTLILGIILNYNIVSFIQKKQENMSAGVAIVLNSVKYSFLLGVLILSMSQIANSTYNPFIYFRF
jgi:alginate O-acetyltransferase complex protein AlgI